MGFISPRSRPSSRRVVVSLLKLCYAKSAMADFWKTRAALAERDCGSVRAALCQGSNLMCRKNFGVSRILNCVRKICGLAGVTYYQKICVVCGACCCASMASLICADGCLAAVAAFACITPISIVSAIYLLLFCSLLPKLLV